MTGPRPGGRRWVLAIGLVTLLLWLAAPTAAAHTEVLSGSTPAAGSVVRAVDTLELRFVDRIQAEAATFTLRSSDGTSHALSVPSYRQDDSVVTVRPVDPVPDGRYRIGYQVIFGDGDPAVGVVEFEVSADGRAKAPAWAVDEPPPTVPRQRFSAGAALPWLVVGAVLAVAGLGFALGRGRRRESSAPTDQQPPDGPDHAGEPRPG